MALAAGLLSGVAACNDDDGGPIGPGEEVSFARVQGVLQADCSFCHIASEGRVFRTNMDSTQLVNSGLVNPDDPENSILITKPAGIVPHGGGTIAEFTAEDQALVAEWISSQPVVFSTTLTALRATAAVTIDGGGDEAAWAPAQPLTAVILGGWAEATQVSMKAVYDDTYLYLLISWADDRQSERRQPWVKQSDGTWAPAAAKPAPGNGLDWAQYVAAHGGTSFDEEGAEFNYEDKLAIIWNTYGSATVAGFDQQGCTALCHDPTVGGRPGTTYNTDPNRAAKKYTNGPDEIADMWHWKLVRQNETRQMDDQYVAYWQIGDPGGEGGRHSDPGLGGYTSNPSNGGVPRYRGPTLGVPPWFILAQDTVVVTAEELAGLPPGAMLPGIVISRATGSRGEIDAYGVFGNGAWTLEVRRPPDHDRPGARRAV